MEIDNLVITMLGKSGSGKTTYMCGLYQNLILKQINGLCLRPWQPNGGGVDTGNLDPKSLKQIEIFRTNYEKLTRKIFPDGTQEFSEWMLDLWHHEFKICASQWIDYKGGLLENYNQNASQLGSLLDRIKRSEALLCFVDAASLMNTKNLSEAITLSGLDVVKFILTELARVSPNALPPNYDLSIAIVLTKVDGVDRVGLLGFDYIYRRCIEAFKDMQPIFNRQSRWKINLFPVSAVGLRKTTRTDKQDIFSDGYGNKSNSEPPSANQFLITAPPEALNCEMPFLWAIQNTLNSRLKMDTLRDIALKIRNHEDFLKEKQKIIGRDKTRISPYSDESTYEADRNFLQIIKTSIEKMKNLTERHSRVII
jgi:hypothetical protein